MSVLPVPSGKLKNGPAQLIGLVVGEGAGFNINRAAEIFGAIHINRPSATAACAVVGNVAAKDCVRDGEVGAQNMDAAAVNRLVVAECAAADGGRRAAGDVQCPATIASARDGRRGGRVAAKAAVRDDERAACVARAPAVEGNRPAVGRR